MDATLTIIKRVTRVPRLLYHNLTGDLLHDVENSNSIVGK